VSEREHSAHDNEGLPDEIAEALDEREYPSGAPLIISVSPTSGLPGQRPSPYVPWTPEDIAQETIAAYGEGAVMAHIHGRNTDGHPSFDPDVLEEIVDRVRSVGDMIIQFSTTGSSGVPIEMRTAPLRLQPEMASLTLGTIHIGHDVYDNPPEAYEFVAAELQRLGIMPELELFSVGLSERAQRLIAGGLIPQPVHYALVLGLDGGMGGSIKNLVTLAATVPREAAWTAWGFGDAELSMAAAAIAMGGHVRVGFEGNIYYRPGVLARSNGELVNRVARLAWDLGRPVATAKEARQILGLERKDSEEKLDG
jgi:3-keto-5-aminohexanoate cleavage enzyme